jgi:hypothetical protein
MLYLRRLTGDPLSFVHVQEDWGREPLFPLQTLYRGFNYVLHPSWSSSPDIYARGVLHSLIILVFMGVMLVSVRRWPISYSAYGLLTLYLILSNPVDGQWTMHNLGRYLMVFFPFYLTLARWGRHYYVHMTILATSLTMFGFLTVLYVRWYAA